MKIAILGTENTHAYEFAKLIKNDPDFSFFELVGAYGSDEKANEKLMNAGFCTYFAASPDEFVGKADAVAVTARHGDLHYEYAMPYIEKGIHAFIDKPFCIKTELAEKMLDTAKKTGALITGGSSLKHLDEVKSAKTFAEEKKRDNKLIGGFIHAPINMVNEYGGFHFYAAHLIEMLINTFGKDIKSVISFCPDKEKNDVNVFFRYPDFEVTAKYTSAYHYGMTVLSKTGSFSFDTSDIGYLNKKELNDFLTVLKKGKMKDPYDDFLIPVKLQTAIEKSYLSGKEIML